MMKMNSNLKCQQKFVTAKLAQTSQLVKGWYDYANSSNKLMELTKDALTDDLERLESDDLASRYADYICQNGGTVSDTQHYKTRILTLPELGEAICGIRFRGMQVDKPFVNVAITTKSLTMAGMAKSVAVLKESFDDFSPQNVRFYIDISEDGINHANSNYSIESVIPYFDKLGMIAKWDVVVLSNQFSNLSQLAVSEPIKQSYRLEIANNLDFHKDYVKALEDIFAKQPQFKNHTRCETREDVQWVMDNGGFNFVLTTIDGKGNSQFAGLMIIAKDKQAGIDGYCIMDKLIVNPLHGQGLGKQFESWVIQRLLQNQLVSPDGILFGEIDFDNKGSLHSAYANGRIEIGRYLWVA